jgi:16S rRNA processing protein RimM
MTNRICVGVILGAHGIKGEVLLRSFTENPTSIMSYGELSTLPPWGKMAIQCLKPKEQDIFIARLRNILDRTAAERLKGVKLYIRRDQLPLPEEGQYYQLELEGLKVVDSQDRVVGHIQGVYNFGAGDILEIKKTPQHKTLIMLPFTHEAFPEINLEKGFIRVNEEILQTFASQHKKKDS